MVNKTIEDLSAEDALALIQYLMSKFNFPINTQSENTIKQNNNISDNSAPMEVDPNGKKNDIANSQASTSDVSNSQNGAKLEAKKRKLHNMKTNNIEISNRFECLSSEDEDENPQNATTKQSIKKPTSNEVNKTKNAKVPPVMMREKDKWLNISNGLRSKNINYTRATNTGLGIKIHPQTIQDYHQLRKHFDEQSVKYFTHDPKSEKPLKIVIKGVFQQLTEEQITFDLDKQGYPVLKCARMMGRNKNPCPFVLVEISKDYKSIFNLKKCCGLDVTVESLKNKQDIIQCHRCQLFGHAQKNCTDDFKCLKCGEKHSTHECEKPRTTPAKCANCGEEHTSKYIYCKMNPNNPKINKMEEKTEKLHVQENKTVKEKSSNLPEPRKHSPVVSNVKPSYSQVTSGATSQNRNTPTKSNDLPAILGEMMLDFLALNPSDQQQLQFLKKTHTLIKIFNGK